MAHREVDIETAELAEFFQGTERLRPLRGLRLVEALERVMAPVLEIEELPQETLPFRVAALWRIVRHTAIVKGMCAVDERLLAATELHPCPWTNPTKPFQGPAAQSTMRRNRAATLLQYHHTDEGLPMLPVGDDGTVKRWIHAAGIVVKDLGIANSAAIDGVTDLLTLKGARMNDVTIDMLMAFEELLIETAQSAIFQAGERPALKHLRDSLGLSRGEALNLVSLARAVLVDDMPTSVEVDRAFMVAQLREQIAQAKACMNMDMEFKAMKLLAMVQGLTRSEPENAAKDFASVVKRVSTEQDTKRLKQQEQGTQLTISETTTVDVTPVITRTLEPIPEEDEDADALAAFDRERNQ